MGSVAFFDRGIDGVEFICSRSHTEIMEMQCDLLMSNSKDPKTMALLKENIGNISDGSLPYCRDSLKLGLWKASDLKKQEAEAKERQKREEEERQKQLLGVKLRCPSGNCGWYSNYPPYSSIASATYCPMCQSNSRGSRFFACVGCGQVRNGTYASCQSCAKQFV